MIFRHTLHSTPEVPLLYAMQEPKQPRIVAGNLTGETPEELCRELRALIRARPFVDKPIDHGIFSLSLQDREKLNDEDVEDLLGEVMAHQGYAQSGWVAIEHFDTNAPHWSVIASRIDATGAVISCNWSGRSIRPLLERMEIQYGLDRTGAGRDGRAPTKDEIERDRRLQSKSYKAELRELIDAAIDRARAMGGTVVDFARALREQAVQARLYLSGGGTVQGIAYAREMEDGAHVAMSGTTLGRGYTWPGLQRHRGLRYDPRIHSVEALQSPPAPDEALNPAPPLRPDPRADHRREERPPVMPMPVPPPDPQPESHPPAERDPQPKQEDRVPLEAPAAPSEVGIPADVLQGIEADLRQLQGCSTVEAKRSAVEVDLRRAEFSKMDADQQLGSARRALLTGLQRIYADASGAVAILDAQLARRGRSLKEPDLSVLATRPEILGPLRPVPRRFLGERAPTPAEARERLQSALPLVRTYIVRWGAVRDLAQAIERFGGEQRTITTELRTLPSSSELRRRIQVRLQEHAPGPEQLARWRAHYPSAMKLVEQDLGRGPVVDGLTPGRSR